MLSESDEAAVNAGQLCTVSHCAARHGARCVHLWAAQSARAQLEEEQQRAERASPAEAAVQERQQAQRASERGADCDVLAAEVAVAEAEEQVLAAKLARLRLSRDARKVTLGITLFTLRALLPLRRHAAGTHCHRVVVASLKL